MLHPAENHDSQQRGAAGNARRLFICCIFSLIAGWCVGFSGLWFSRHVGGPVLATATQVITLPLAMCASFALLLFAGRRVDRRRRSLAGAGALPGTLLDAQIGAVPEDELSIIGERETFTVAALTTVGWFLQLLFALSVWLAPAPDSPEPSTVVPGWTMIAQATLIALSVLFLYRYVEERARSLLAAASASTL